MLDTSDGGGEPVTIEQVGAIIEQPPERSFSMKQLVFDWGGVVAIAIAAMTWATLTAETSANTREIERLRAAGDARATADVRIAETMATKADVQRVSDQVQALALELRNGRAR